MNLINLDLDYVYDQKIEREKIVKPTELDKLNGNKPSVVVDTMFKTMFNNTKRIKYSAKMFSYFFDKSYEELLNGLTLTKNELDKDRVYDKGERADFFGKFGKTKLNVEVNNCSKASTMERNLNYAFKYYCEDNIVGTTDEFYLTVQFNLNNFSFVCNDEVIDVFTIRNDKGLSLTNKLVIIQIYLPNLYKKMYNVGIEGLSEIERFLLLITDEDIELSKKLVRGDKVMEDFIKDAIESSKKESFIGEYSTELKAKEWGHEEGYNEGHEEGYNEGHEETTVKMIENMLKENADIEFISRVSGLNEEEIKRIANK